jgi:hypothetical protein
LKVREAAEAADLKGVTWWRVLSGMNNHEAIKLASELPEYSYLTLAS